MGYDSLRDPHLRHFLTKPNSLQRLQDAALVAKNGRILSEREHREILRVSERREKVIDGLASKIVDAVVEQQRRSVEKCLLPLTFQRGF